MKFKNIFTEYDDNIEKSIDLDPLGIGVIWRYFGQQIFDNKITASTFRIRNFNINLFNHLIIKHLFHHNEKIQDLMLMNKKETTEKLLIILENFIVYSWFNHKEDWDKQGLLGTSKAISKWNNKDAITFDISKDFKDIELLTSQKTTGVNGTYKGSFIAMFNESNLEDENLTKDYDRYFENDELLQDIRKKFLPKFQELFDAVIEYFENDEKLPNEKMQKLYTEIYAKHDKIAQSTKSFWLKYLGFDSNEARAIYDIVDTIELNNRYLDYKKIIEEANSNFKSKKFQNILSLEPKLSYLENIYNYLLSCDGKTIKEIEKSKCIDFPKITFEKELESISEDNEAKNRLQKMTEIYDVKSLIDYHSEIMGAREQQDWIDKDTKDKKIKINNFSTDLEIDEDTLCEKKEYPDWNRNYYLNSVYYIKRGLEQ